MITHVCFVGTFAVGVCLIPGSSRRRGVRRAETPPQSSGYLTTKPCVFGPAEKGCRPTLCAVMDDPPAGWEHSDRVYQAQGMVGLQAGCTVDEALAKMTEEAKASNMSLEAIATAVVERRMRFGPPSPDTNSV